MLGRIVKLAFLFSNYAVSYAVSAAKPQPVSFELKEPDSLTEIPKYIDSEVANVLSFQKPTPYEYGLMADAAYDDAVRHQNSVIQLNEFDNEWELEEDPFLGLEGFRALLFTNPRTEQLVLSYRGTESNQFLAAWQTLSVDAKTVIGGDYRGHATNATQIPFDSRVVEYLAKGYQLSFTGHSLGGFLAEISVDLCAHEKFVEETMKILQKSNSSLPIEKLKRIYDDASAVTFDSPGLEHSVVKRRLSDKPLKILSFKFGFNPVNMALMPGNRNLVYQLTPGNSISSVSEACIESEDSITAVSCFGQLIATHSLQEALKLFDKETGYPSEGNWRRILSWPLLDPLDIKKLLDHRELTNHKGENTLFGIFASAWNMLHSFVPYTAENRALQGIMKEVFGLQNQQSKRSETMHEVVENFRAHHYLVGETDHKKLMQTIHIEMLPTRLSKFIKAFNGFRNIAVSPAVDEELRSFISTANLSLELGNFLNRFVLSEGDELTYPEMFLFKDQLLGHFDRANLFDEGKHIADSSYFMLDLYNNANTRLNSRVEELKDQIAELEKKIESATRAQKSELRSRKSELENKLDEFEESIAKLQSFAAIHMGVNITTGESITAVVESASGNAVNILVTATAGKNVSLSAEAVGGARLKAQDIAAGGDIHTSAYGGERAATFSKDIVVNGSYSAKVIQRTPSPSSSPDPM